MKQIELLVADAVLKKRFPLRGKEIEFLRRAFGLSSRKFADLLKLSHVALVKWKKIERRRISFVNEIAVRVVLSEFGSPHVLSAITVIWDLPKADDLKLLLRRRRRYVLPVANGGWGLVFVASLVVHTVRIGLSSVGSIAIGWRAVNPTSGDFMYKVIGVALLFSQVALASTQKIHCKDGQNEFSFEIRNAATTFTDSNDCFESSSASCRKFRQNVTGDEYPKIMELTLTTHLNTRLYARGPEGTSVSLIIPDNRIAQSGAFQSRSEICIQDCVMATFNCTSTMQ